MSSTLLLSGVLVAVAGVVGVALVARRQFDDAVEERVDALVSAGVTGQGGTVRMSSLSGLPPPAQRYFHHVLQEGQPYVRTVRIRQKGTFRDAQRSAEWSPFTAVQHVTTDPPGFVWDATIRMMSWIPVRAVDEYRGGRGGLCAKLGGMLTVMRPDESPELDEGELLRYLAEALLYPTALLPDMGVTWSPIDDRTARATLVDGETRASLLFYFNEENEVDCVEGRRAYTTSNGATEYRPWRGYWRDYVVLGGMHVPTAGEVAWCSSEGEVPYWRGDIESVEYGTGAAKISLHANALRAEPALR